MAISAHGSALAGVLLRVVALALGRGPRTESNDLYHRVMLLILVAILILLFTRAAKTAVGRRARSAAEWRAAESLRDSTHRSGLLTLAGCRGLDGCDGINTLCKNGYEVGTEQSDCWLPHSVGLNDTIVAMSATHQVAELESHSSFAFILSS
jgi:hypothetical protein